MNFITYFLFDKVNNYGRLCELISIAYHIMVLVALWKCMCKSFVRRRNLNGDDEQNASLWAKKQSVWGITKRLKYKICAVACQWLTGQFIFISKP